MTRNCDHAILPLLLSASCKPWTLILIAPPRRKQSEEDKLQGGIVRRDYRGKTFRKRSVLPR
jgi:hypothetical protein